MRTYFVLILALLLWPALAFSGSIQGKAIYNAEVQLPPTLKTGKYKKACGPEVPNEKLLVENKGIKNVVVSLEGGKLKGKPGEYHLDQNKCRYEPHVLAMMKGSELIIHSSDPINHNIHTYSFDNDPINIMFVPGQEDYSQEMEEPEIIKVECDLHHWMTAWVLVTDNSFFNVSDASGKFEIKDVPPGKYTLNAWHEVLGSISQKITVGEGVTKVEFDFSKLTPQLSKK